MADTRMPTQKRSIEKRNRIIEKGFELMCEEGFYNTTTPQIAHYAEVSTGIIYQYFTDKKEIFIEGVKNYNEKIMHPMINTLKTEKIDINNLKELLNTMLDSSIKSHTISQKAHEELMAMSHLDEDIGKIFSESELRTTEKLVELLETNNIKIKNSREKVHIILGIIDNFCHEVVYHKHLELDYENMKNEVINIINTILTDH